MNLIYSNEGFKATKFSESQSYSLDEITFFLDKKYVKLRLYLVLKDQKIIWILLGSSRSIAQVPTIITTSAT